GSPGRRRMTEPRTFFVTGANSGIGRALVEALAARGDRVVLATRSEERTRPVLSALQSRSPAARAQWVSLAVSDLGSVRPAAQGQRIRRLRRHQAQERAAREGAGAPPGRHPGDDLRAPPRSSGLQRLALAAAAAAMVREAVHALERARCREPALLRHRARARG